SGRSDDVPGRHVEPRPMPRTLDDGALKSALAQRPTQVGAGIVETVHLPADLEQRVRPLIRRNALRTALRYLALHPQDCAHGPSRGRTCSSRCRWSTALGAGRHRGAGVASAICSRFVDPLLAGVEGVPAEVTWLTAAKKSVPTNAWWSVAR